MQIQLDIGFDQLINVIKKLPPKQWSRLKKEVERTNAESKKQQDLEAFMLSAPVLNEEQLHTIEEARKQINQWQPK